MATFEEVLEGLTRVCRLEYAEAWDNVGLLVQPASLWGADGRQTRVERVMCCIDLTLAALAEAKARKVRVVVAYHPVLFHALKRLTPDASTKARIVCECIEAGIAVFCPHSALDALPARGMNDWLAGAILARCPQATCVPLRPPPQPLLAAEGGGAGRVVTLPELLSLRELLPLLRARMAPGAHLRVAVGAGRTPDDATVRTVALCVGSGSELLGKASADVLVSGEMTHHVVLDAAERGSHVVLSEHTATERGYLAGVLKPALEELFNGRVEVFVSAQETELLTLAP